MAIVNQTKWLQLALQQHWKVLEDLSYLVLVNPMPQEVTWEIQKYLQKEKIIWVAIYVESCR